MNRVYNFSAGHSALPLSVLETAAKEMGIEIKEEWKSEAELVK